MDIYFTDEEMKALDKQVEISERKYYEELFKEKFAEGEAKVFEKGVKQGIEQEKLKTAKKLLEQKVSIDIILVATGLSKEKLKELSEN